MSVAVPVELWITLGGLSVFSLSSALFWRIRSRKVTAALNERNLQSGQNLKSGVVVTALTLEIDVASSGGTRATSVWHPKLQSELKSLAQEVGLKVGSCVELTFVLLKDDEALATDSIQQVLNGALTLMASVRSFATRESLELACRCGIHSDIVPVRGLGSTIAMTQVVRGSIENSESANPGEIAISEQCRVWLGAHFDLERFVAQPALVAASVVA